MTVDRQFTVLVILLVAAIRPVTGADDMAFPGRTWEEATPESQGADSTRLQAAVDYLREAVGRNGVKRMVTVRLGLDQQEDEITTAEYNTFLRMAGEAIATAAP